MQRFEAFVEVDAPVERVFDLFSDFESFPRWMGGVRGVRRRGRRMTHWVAETALDLDVEWDAETTVFEPDHRIVWRSVGGDVRADGEAVFSVTQEGTTLVRVVLGYGTPGGRTGERVARFFGRHPGRQLEEDLEHFKRLAERGTRERRQERPYGRDERRREGGRGESAASRARRFDAELREEQRRQAVGDGARRLHRIEERERGEFGGRPMQPARGPVEGRRRGRDEEDFGRGDDFRRGEEFAPRHALTPRERERERGRERDRAVTEEERRRAGFFLRRGVDRLMEEPPPRGRRF